MAAMINLIDIGYKFRKDLQDIESFCLRFKRLEDYLSKTITNITIRDIQQDSKRYAMFSLFKNICAFQPLIAEHRVRCKQENDQKRVE